MSETHTPPRVEASTEVLSALSRLVRTSRSVARQRSAALGASGTSMAILKALAHEGTTHDRPGDLALSAGVAPSVVSRALARLELDGLVGRTPDAHDARACHIAITERGLAHLAGVQREYAEVLTSGLAALSDQELERLPGLLATLDHAVHLAAQATLPAPQTSAPQTSAPQTSAPQTSAPQTSAPQTSAPQTSAPTAADHDERVR